MKDLRLVILMGIFVISFSLAKEMAGSHAYLRETLEILKHPDVIRFHTMNLDSTLLTFSRWEPKSFIGKWDVNEIFEMEGLSASESSGAFCLEFSIEGKPSAYLTQHSVYLRWNQETPCSQKVIDLEGNLFPETIHDFHIPQEFAKWITEQWTNFSDTESKSVNPTKERRLEDTQINVDDFGGR